MITCGRSSGAAARRGGGNCKDVLLCGFGFYELVRVRGAGAVRVARDELVAFVVHRVAQRARQRHQEANERDAEDEDAAREVEVLRQKN